MDNTTPQSDILDLDRVYELCDNSDIEGVTDLIFDKIDRAMIDGRFEEINELFQKINVKRLNTFAMRSFLCISHCAKHRLPYYSMLYEDIEREMTLLRGQPVTSRILKNLN